MEYTQLLRQLWPYPSESLSSFICRLELANYYPGNFIKKQLKLSHTSYDLLPNTIEKFEIINKLSGVPLQLLYNISYHNFWQQDTDNKKKYKEKGLRNFYFHSSDDLEKYFLSDKNVKFCPLCFSEKNAYHRLAWGSPLHNICIKHKIYLVSECPSCNSNISIIDLFKNKCSMCKSEIISSRDIYHHVTDEEISIEKFLLNIMYKGIAYPKEVKNINLFKNYSNLQVIYIYLIKSLLEIYSSDTDFNKVPYERIFWAMKESKYIIENWPFSFHVFLFLFEKNDTFDFFAKKPDMYSFCYLKNNKLYKYFSPISSEIQYYSHCYKFNDRHIRLSLKDYWLLQFLKEFKFFQISDFEVLLRNDDQLIYNILSNELEILNFDLKIVKI